MIDKIVHTTKEEKHIINRILSGKNLMILAVGPTSPKSQNVNPDNIKLKFKHQNLILSPFVLFLMHAVSILETLYKHKYTGIKKKIKIVSHPNVINLNNINSMLKNTVIQIYVFFRSAI